MTKSNLELAMDYLDVIENELNKIAEAVGHPSFEDFFKQDELKKAA